jgi:hypothetical protein
MIWFKILWAIDAAVAFAFFYFFVAGLGDHTVSFLNWKLWLLLGLVIFAVLYGSLWLKKKGQKTWSIILLILLAVPALLYILFILYAISGSFRWK